MQGHHSQTDGEVSIDQEAVAAQAANRSSQVAHDAGAVEQDKADFGPALGKGGRVKKSGIKIKIV